MPLSVTLVGALVTGAGFLRPLRHRAVAGAPELAGWAARIAVLWVLGLAGLAYAARQTFAVSLGDGTLGDIGDLFGVAPRIGFAADVTLTLLAGVLWLAGVMALALLVSRGAPLPAAAAAVPGIGAPGRVRHGRAAARLRGPGDRDRARRGGDARAARADLALMLLGMPNLVWLALTTGLGATWEGRVDGPFGLPMPHVLDEVLRASDTATLNLGTIAEYDGRVWWLVAVDAVLLLAAAFLTAARHRPGRGPGSTPCAWRSRSR